MAKIKNDDPYLIASVFGAHMNNLSRGFTYNSIIFLFNTFKNWSCPGRPDYKDFDTQVKDFLENLIKNSHAKKLTRKEPYRYKLNNSGLIELTRVIVNKNYVYQRGDFFFVFSYLSNYSPRTFLMMKNKGSYFPFDTRLEIENLLDLNKLIDSHKKNCKKEISTLKERIELSEQIIKFVNPLFKQGLDSIEIIKQIENSYPYALHSTLELANFLEEFTDKQVIWEATSGMKNRKRQIWEFKIEKISLQIKQLDKLKKDYNKYYKKI